MDELFDQARHTAKPELHGQIKRVHDALQGAWRTLPEIRALTNDKENSISARIRALKRDGYRIEKRRRGRNESGLYEYKLLEG